MKKVVAIIECTENNYSAYIEGQDGIVSTGSSLDNVKANLIEAITEFVEACEEMGCEVPDELKGEYDIVFKVDVKSLLNIYSGIFTKAGLERLTGINQKQLWHYANGKTTPRPAQVIKIETALHNLGRELISLHF